MPNTNPTAAPDDYPPAVIQEADAVGRAAADEAFRRGRGDQATHDAAEAIAAVLARHTVAVRAQERLYTPDDDVADLRALREQSAQAAREASGTDTTPALLTYDDATAGRFTAQPSASTSFTFTTGEPLRTLAFLVSQPDGSTRLMLRDHTGADHPVEDFAAIAAERDALAKRVEALRGALQGMHDGIGGADHATQHAAAALAADDKAAQS